MQLNKLFTIWIILLLVAHCAWADDLPRAAPEALGFSSDRLEYMDQFFAGKVQNGELAGIVTLVARHGKIAHLSAIGYADVEKKRRLQIDSMFRLYSMTKPITAVALMMLYAEGDFDLREPLSKYIPEFAGLRVLRKPDGPLDDTLPLDKPPTIWDAMRHTAGFTHGLEVNAFDSQYTKANIFGLDVSLAEMMRKLSKIPLRYPPSTKWVYSVGPDMESRQGEVLSGMSFDRFLSERIFKPLDMQDTGFWLPPDKANRLATVHWSKNGKLTPLDDAHGHPEGGVLTQPWLVNSYTAKHAHKGGSIGLVATAGDYWRFAQMLLNGGELNGVRILSPHAVQFMLLDHVSAIDRDQKAKPFHLGLGFNVLKDPAAAGFIGSDGAYGWGGAAATAFWVDPKEDMVVVVMTQHMGVPAAWLLENQMHALVYGALMERSGVQPPNCR